MMDWGEENTLPLPTGAINTQAERQHAIGLYSGILVTTGAATPLTTVDQGIPYWGSSFTGKSR